MIQTKMGTPASFFCERFENLLANFSQMLSKVEDGGHLRTERASTTATASVAQRTVSVRRVTFVSDELSKTWIVRCEHACFAEKCQNSCEIQIAGESCELVCKTIGLRIEATSHRWT